MYVFVDKKTQVILCVANASPGDDRPPAEFYPPYDPETMDVGRAPDQFLPAKFAIKKGLVVDLAPPPAETIAQARTRKLDEINALALSLRATLVPDYQLLNAGLGVYDAARVEQLRNTVNVFRAEVMRLEGLVASAKTAKDLDALKPAFPTTLISGKAATKTKSNRI